MKNFEDTKIIHFWYPHFLHLIKYENGDPNDRRKKDKLTFDLFLYKAYIYVIYFLYLYCFLKNNQLAFEVAPVIGLTVLDPDAVFSILTVPSVSTVT